MSLGQSEFTKCKTCNRNCEVFHTGKCLTCTRLDNLEEVVALLKRKQIGTRENNGRQ